MISLPFSVGTYNPTNHLTPTLRSITRIGNNPHIIESFALKLNETKYSGTNSALLSRREAIGIGFCSSFIQFLVPKPSSAASQGGAATPCDFTAAPSGLAYCDKVIGTGAEAVKGLLIKAHYIGRLEDGKVFDSSYNRGKPLAFRIGVGEDHALFHQIQCYCSMWSWLERLNQLKGYTTKYSDKTLLTFVFSLETIARNKIVFNGHHHLVKALFQLKLVL